MSEPRQSRARRAGTRFAERAFSSRSSFSTLRLIPKPLARRGDERRSRTAREACASTTRQRPVFERASEADESNHRRWKNAGDRKPARPGLLTEEGGGEKDEACATTHAAAPCFSSLAIDGRHWLGNCQCRRIGPSRLKSLTQVLTAPLLYSLRQTPRIRLAGCHPVREFCMAPMASRTHWRLASNVVTAGETSASRSPGPRDERHVQSGKQMQKHVHSMSFTR